MVADEINRTSSRADVSDSRVLSLPGSGNLSPLEDNKAAGTDRKFDESELLSGLLGAIGEWAEGSTGLRFPLFYSESTERFGPSRYAAGLWELSHVEPGREKAPFFPPGSG
jgi:hypothetical protein